MNAVPRANCIWKTLGKILRKGPSSQNVQVTKHLESPSLGSWGFSESQIPFQWVVTFTLTAAQLSRGDMVRAARGSGVTAASPVGLAPHHCRRPLGQEAAG